MPMPMPMAAGRAPEAPKPMGPMKTVMIGAGGDRGRLPDRRLARRRSTASNAYQTLRLQAGPDEDRHRAAVRHRRQRRLHEHRALPDHVLAGRASRCIDGGSTNGCYVNDRKVQKQDLVDNDMITLGKTNFKFKSIN